MKEYFKKFLGFSVGPVISAVISVVMIPLITYFVVPDEYGKASVFLTVQSILIMVITLGFDSAFVSHFNKIQDRRKLDVNCLLVPLIVSLLLIGLSPAYYRIVSKLIFDEIIFLPIFLLAVFSFFVVIERFILLSLRMKEKALLYSFLNVGLKLFVFVATFFFIFFVRTDFLSVVYAALLGQLFFDVLLLFVFRKEISFSFKKIDRKFIVDLAKFGVPIAFASIVGYLLSSADTFFLKWLSTNEEIGYYGIALKIVGFLAIVQNSFSTFWTPIAFRWYAEEKPLFYFERVGRILSAIMLAVYFLIICFKDLLLVFISSQYAPSIRMIPFLILYPVMYTIGTTTDLGIQFSKKTNSILIASVVSLGLNLFLNYYLIPVFGGVGASLATGLSFVLFFWMKTIFSSVFWKRIKISHFILLTFVLLVAATINTFWSSSDILLPLNLNLFFIGILFYSKDIRYLFGKIWKKK